MRLPAVSPRRFHLVTEVALWLLIFIVVSGAAVRLTGSGLGCPEWPTCEAGSLAPAEATSAHPWIEFINRLVTGAVSVAVIAAVAGALFRSPRRRDLIWLAAGLVVGVVAQALLGALVVRLHVHPVVVQGHFVLSALLVADAVVLRHRAGRADQGPGPAKRAAAASTTGEPAGPMRSAAADAPAKGSWARRHPAVPAGMVRLSWALVAAGAVVMLAGTVVTGTGPHAGDEAAERLGWFSITSVARVHSGLTWAFLAGVVALVVWCQRAGVPAMVAARARLLLVAVICQGGLGYLQYAAGVPPILVGLHVFGAMLVWVAVLRVALGASGVLEGTDHLRESHRGSDEAAAASPDDRAAHRARDPATDDALAGR